MPKSIFLRAVILASAVVAARADKLTASDDVSDFVSENCVDCHSGSEAEADLRLDSLPFNLNEATVRQRWIEIHDRVAAGEMPPSGSGELDAGDTDAFLKALATPLAKSVRAEQRTQGRGVVRRLNRVEYETVLSDLFGIPLRIQERLPADALRDGFDTVGAALNISSVQMEAYLDVLDDVLDQATTLYEKPDRDQWKLDYRETRGIMEEYRRTGPFHILPDGVAFFAPEKHAHLNAVLDHFTIPYSATYQVRVSAYAIRNDKPITLTIRTGGPGHSESDQVPKTLLGHVTTRAGEPKVFEFEQRLERGQFFRIYPASLPYMRFVPNLKERQKDYQGPGVVVQWVEVDGPILPQWPPQSHEQLWGGVPMKPMADAKPNRDPNEHLRNAPTEIAEPRLTRVSKDKRNRETGNQWVYDPKQGTGGEKIYRRARIPDSLSRTLQLAPEDPKQEATRLLARFLPLAYRRPTAPDELRLFEGLVHKWLDDGDDFETAMRSGYKAILTSPLFLYHQATVGQASSLSSQSSVGQASSLSSRTTVGQASSLSQTDVEETEHQDAPVASRAGDRLEAYPTLVSRDRLEAYPTIGDHALAERLSFFLWSSLPDNELRRIADAEELGNAETMREQVERMLDDPKSDRFVENFLGQWLDLRQLNFTSPDSVLYPEHDPVLQWSLAQETHRFFRELVEENLSVTNIVESDFAMLNSRLAEHYDIAGVDDMAFRKVKLPHDSVRGGVLTQASVLKVTANGTTTSPVVRGAWVLERIIGTPASPPPPGIPAIEPDIRGATTVRQQLEQHRNADSCAACHAKIDPPGVALENFDPIGRWRERYRAIDPEKADIKIAYLPKKPVPIRYKPGLRVDAADQLPGGQRFQNVQEFQQILLADPDQLARNFIGKLIVYATGATITFADRQEIDDILARTTKARHPVRTLIHEVVQSEMFRTK